MEFYSFLDYYRERYNTHNKLFDTKNHKDFYAILDGQQRITSLYLALFGHYDKGKRKTKWQSESHIVIILGSISRILITRGFNPLCPLHAWTPSANSLHAFAILRSSESLTQWAHAVSLWEKPHCCQILLRLFQFANNGLSHAKGGQRHGMQSESHIVVKV